MFCSHLAPTPNLLQLHFESAQTTQFLCLRETFQSVWASTFGLTNSSLSIKSCVILVFLQPLYFMQSFKALFMSVNLNPSILC